jgi:hypothetical protein
MPPTARHPGETPTGSTVAHAADNGPAPRGELAALVAAVGVRVGDLAAAVGIWDGRDDGKPEPEARRAASAAVGAIDFTLGDLHQLRARIMAQARRSDDLADARADELLARLRGETP